MKLRFRPRYADVAATIALLFAMSGTAYAVASQLPPDTVDTQAIQNGAVTALKLHGNSVNSAKVVDNTLTGADVQDGSIGNADLGVDSVQAPQIADNSIDGGEIVDNSLTGTDIAPNAIGNSELAAGSVDGTKVADNSIGLADLVGANINGAISFTLGANACGTLNMGVSGASVGEVVLLSYTGTVALPPGVMFGPFRVVSAGVVTTRACNVTATAMTVTDIGVHIVTFG